MRATAVLTVALLCEGLSATVALAGNTVTVKITDMTFDPAEISISAGDTVEWVNADVLDHTATAISGDWEVALPAGASAGRAFLQAGTVAYYCRFHPNMTGTIRVRLP